MSFIGRLLPNPKCCECQKTRRPLLPWAKRGRRLTFICRECFDAYDYAAFLPQMLDAWDVEALMV